MFPLVIRFQRPDPYLWLTKSLTFRFTFNSPTARPHRLNHQRNPIVQSFPVALNNVAIALICSTYVSITEPLQIRSIIAVIPSFYTFCMVIVFTASGCHQGIPCLPPLQFLASRTCYSVAMASSPKCTEGFTSVGTHLVLACFEKTPFVLFLIPFADLQIRAPSLSVSIVSRSHSSSHTVLIPHKHPFHKAILVICPTFAAAPHQNFIQLATYFLYDRVHYHQRWLTPSPPKTRLQFNPRTRTT